MNGVRCTSCTKLLLKAVVKYEACIKDADIEIKCNKCKVVNKYKTK